MMRTWADVTEEDWFYNEVMEATNYLLEDGSPLVAGIPYGKFVDGAPYIYEEKEAGADQSEFILDKKYTLSKENPLLVYIDGVQTLCESVENLAGDKTRVKLYHSVKSGSIVSFVSKGIPDVDKTFKKPIWPGNVSDFRYPGHLDLMFGASYHYNPLGKQYPETLTFFGRQLKRLQIPEAMWTNAKTEELRQAVVKAHIGYRDDCYVVSPISADGDHPPDQKPKAKLYYPYKYNGATGYFQYNSLEGVIVKRGGKFKPKTPVPYVWHSDRFFPNAVITRAEALVFLDRLHRSFFSRFSDQDPPVTTQKQTIITTTAGETTFTLDFPFPAGEDRLSVVVNGEKDPKVYGTDYTEIDDRTIQFAQPLPLYSLIEITYHCLQYQQHVVTYEGQSVFKLNFPYDPSKLIVELGNTRVYGRQPNDPKSSACAFVFIDANTILWEKGLPMGEKVTFTYQKTASSRGMKDVGTNWKYMLRPDGSHQKIDGIKEYWVGSVLAMEDLRLNDGSYLVNGMGLNNFEMENVWLYGEQVCNGAKINVDNTPLYNAGNAKEIWFMPYTPLTRAEAVAFLNRFRKWGIERFKGVNITKQI